MRLSKREAQIETKEVGLRLSSDSGEFVNTTVIDGKLQLKMVDGLVEEEGTWISEVVDLEHKFKEFQKISLDAINSKGSSHKIEIRKSEDGVEFTEWEETTSDGKFLSTPSQFIQVKITLHCGFSSSGQHKIDFTKEESKKEISEPQYFKVTDKGIKLISSYEIPFEKTDAYEGEGFVMEATLVHDGLKGMKDISIL